MGDWAADGLLAIFFFVAGLELKRELVVGELANRRRSRPRGYRSARSAMQSTTRSPSASSPGLLVGKVAGIFGGAYVAVRLGLGSLPPRVAWADVLPVAVLGGIGYTVSLLIAGHAPPDAAAERSAAAILLAAVLASVVAVLLLCARSRTAEVG